VSDEVQVRAFLSEFFNPCPQITLCPQITTLSSDEAIEFVIASHTSGSKSPCMILRAVIVRFNPGLSIKEQDELGPLA